MTSSGNIIWSDKVLAIAAQQLDAGADPASALDVALNVLSRKSDPPKKSKLVRYPQDRRMKQRGGYVRPRVVVRKRKVA